MMRLFLVEVQTGGLIQASIGWDDGQCRGAGPGAKRNAGEHSAADCAESEGQHAGAAQGGDPGGGEQCGVLVGERGG